VFVEFSRGGLLARSTGFIAILAALSLGSGAAAFADSGERQTARYFTINEVLAKLDKGGQNIRPSALQLAALDVPAAGNSASAPSSAGDSNEPFGFATFRAPEGMLWVKWRKLETELAGEAEAVAACRAAGPRCTNAAAQKYLALIDESRRLPERARIAQINRAINAAIRYTGDEEQFGKPDVWTAPLATLSSGRGDCEDYAIAKYVALRDAGFAAEDVRLLIVHDRNARQDHAVASVRQGGQWLMLDNRHDILLEQKDARHFVPLFALDRDGVKLFAAPYDRPAPQTATGPAHAAPASAGHEPNAESLGLRLDTFEPPQLRGRF
jgi:predicted transglutaminase-like cysteine proteinase